MDIEGGESDALKGAGRILVDHHPMILVALHGGQHCRYCPELLRTSGYKVFDLHGKIIEGFRQSTRSLECRTTFSEAKPPS
jgi:hypothetical protein